MGCEARVDEILAQYQWLIICSWRTHIRLMLLLVIGRASNASDYRPGVRSVTSHAGISNAFLPGLEWGTRQTTIGPPKSRDAYASWKRPCRSHRHELRDCGCINTLSLTATSNNVAIRRTGVLINTFEFVFGDGQQNAPPPQYLKPANSARLSNCVRPRAMLAWSRALRRSMASRTTTAPSL